MDVSLRPAKHLFTVEQFDRMGEAGIFGPEDRVELIEGEIVEMSPIGNPHAGQVDRLTHLFVPRLGDRAIVRVQSHVVTSDISKPQPDLALLRPRPDYYAGGAPRPEDMFLIVEVSDTTLRWDRDSKTPLYGRSGVLEAWVFDVQRHVVLVHRGPCPEGYAETFTVDREGSVSLVAFPDIELRGGELLG